MPNLDHLTPTTNGSGLTGRADGRKVLRITIEFTMGTKKSHGGRLNDAYAQAVMAADRAVKDIMLEGAIAETASSMIYGYRHIEGERVVWEENEPVVVEGPWES